MLTHNLSSSILELAIGIGLDWTPYTAELPFTRSSSRIGFIGHYTIFETLDQAPSKTGRE